MFAALGRGDIGLNQIVNRITGASKVDEEGAPQTANISQITHTGINIQGMSNLLSYSR